MPVTIVATDQQLHHVDQIVVKVGHAIRVKILEKIPTIIEKCNFEDVCSIDQDLIEKTIREISS